MNFIENARKIFPLFSFFLFFWKMIVNFSFYVGVALGEFSDIIGNF
jgi:hypothetical protein